MQVLRSNGFSLSAWVGVLAISLMTLVSPRPAEAVTVTVGGFVYDLTVLPSQTFNAANTGGALTSMPWWGNPGLANSLADAYALVVGPSATAVRFAFSTSPFIFFPDLIANSYEVTTTAAVNLTSSFTFLGTASYVTGTRTPVPEIDGPVLARAALIVLALYIALLVARRRRVQVAAT